MRKALVAVCFLAFASAAVMAQMPSEAPISLAAILSQPAVSGGCPPSQSEVQFAATRVGTSLEKATCFANCGTDPVVSCTGTTCTGVDRNCPANQRGHVSCTTNGVTTTTFCQSTCPISGNCQTCDTTGDCFACCRCGGGTLRQCSGGF
jgi:hypothetical protein